MEDTPATNRKEWRFTGGPWDGLAIDVTGLGELEHPAEIAVRKGAWAKSPEVVYRQTDRWDFTPIRLDRPRVFLWTSWYDLAPQSGLMVRIAELERMVKSRDEEIWRSYERLVRAGWRCSILRKQLETAKQRWKKRNDGLRAKLRAATKPKLKPKSRAASKSKAKASFPTGKVVE